MRGRGPLRGPALAHTTRSMRPTLPLVIILLSAVLLSAPVAGRVAAGPRAAAAAAPAVAVAQQQVGQTAATGSAPVALDPEVVALRTNLQRLVEGTGWRGARWSVLVVSLDR